MYDLKKNRGSNLKDPQRSDKHKTRVFASYGRFLFTEAATFGGLSSINGFVIGVGLVSMLVMLLGVIFTIPAHGLPVPVLELLSLAVLVVARMIVSALVCARRLARHKVVEALRELYPSQQAGELNKVFVTRIALIRH